MAMCMHVCMYVRIFDFEFWFLDIEQLSMHECVFNDFGGTDNAILMMFLLGNDLRQPASGARKLFSYGRYTFVFLLYFVSFFCLKCPLGMCWVARSQMVAPCQERTIFQKVSKHA